MSQTQSIESLRRKLVGLIDAEWEPFVKAFVAEHPERELISPVERLGLALRDAVDRVPGVAAVPWSPREPLPGTVEPGAIVEVCELKPGEHIGRLKMDRRIVSASLIYKVWDADAERAEGLTRVVADVVEAFRAAVRERGLDPATARPLPHLPRGWAAYLPVSVEGIPCRLIASFSVFDQGWAISLDSIFPTPAEPIDAPAKPSKPMWEQIREAVQGLAGAIDGRPTEATTPRRRPATSMGVCSDEAAGPAHRGD